MKDLTAFPTRLRHGRRAFKATALVALGVAFSSFAQAQTYRDSYPLVDTASLNNLSVNLNIQDPTDAQMQQIADAGFKFVRYDLHWDSIETRKGVYDWRVVDRMMAKARAKGIRAMLLIAYGNRFYTADTGAPNTPVSRAAYARFAAAAAARYARQGVIWEIFNEPNLPVWWTNPNPADYAALVNATADAIRSVSPDEWLVGLTTELLRPDNRVYVEAVLSAPGVLAKLDGIGFHPYTQAGPESMAAQWAETRAMVESKRPANHPVAMMAGEVGYFRSWPGITEDVQAAYTVRLALFNLAQGIGFTNIFNYDDMTSTEDWQSTAGLTRSGTNLPYPAYFAVQRMTSALKDYKFSKRLDLGRADDYCLLFSKATDVTDTKIVCWTAGAPHVLNVPSSAVSFDQVHLAPAASFASGLIAKRRQGAMISAQNGGLAVAATGEPVLFDSIGPNPLLNVAAAWSKLPPTVTLSTKADAMGQLGSLIVSPAWAAMPAGATLKIEDIPAEAWGYDRPSFTTTLTNLPSLTLNSAQVQSVFNSLGALQDAMDRPRTLKFTISLPDGTSVTQSAAAIRKQPLAAFATTPSNQALTLRVENPTGAPFQGTIKANSGTLSVPQGVNFVRGETWKMLFFPTLPSSAIEQSMTFELFDNGANAVDPGRPVIDSSALFVYRTPNFAPGAGWSIATKGPNKHLGTVSMGYSVANWLFITGGATAEVSYTFAKGVGSCYLALSPPSSVGSRSFSKVPVSLGMWVKGDGSRNWLRTQLLDSAGQSFQATYGVVDWTGWKWVSVPLAGNLTDHWGGANDGVVRGAVRVLTPLILDSNWNGTGGRISMFGMTITGQK